MTKTTIYPAGAWHNNSENYLEQQAVPALVQADEDIKYWYGVDITTTITNAVEYIIITQGTFDFTTVGAADNNLGTVFTATGNGTLGTGDLVRATADDTPRAIYYNDIQSDVYDLYAKHKIFANIEDYKRRGIATYSVEQTDLETFYNLIDDPYIRDEDGQILLDENGYTLLT